MNSLTRKHSIIKIGIPVQSVSDLITNSSSEVFCRISSDDHLDEIWELLIPLFNNYDAEMYPCLRERVLEEEKEYLTVEEIKELPYKWLEVEMPYSMSEAEDFYKAGLEAILTKNFGENYQITYYDED